MRRHGLIHGRRGAALGASAAVLCLGGVLAACGGDSGDDGYAAVGAAGPTPERAPGKAVPPDGEVELTPLDDEARDEGGGGHPAKRGGSSADGTGKGAAGAAGSGGSGGKAADGGGPGSTGKPGAPGGGGSTADTPGRTGSGGSGGTPGSPATPGSPGTGSPGTGSPGTGSPGTGPGSPPTTTPPPPPPAPAALKVGAPARAGADKRWCEKVTVQFRNTGGSPVRSGTVTFATHIIGALGVDWGTRYSTQPLPGPIAAGAAVNKTYTVCVDAWRVPLGMRVETQDVTADWK
ncbi:MAG TPA: hypothetical protein VFH94_07540 [Streptomyces sp.]|nr:hypothetical protein [Streptomyces sp.]